MIEAVIFLVIAGAVVGPPALAIWRQHKRVIGLLDEGQRLSEQAHNREPKTDG